MEKAQKYAPIALLVFFLLIVTCFTISGKIADNRYYECYINGRVSKMEYSTREIPLVQIRGKEYYLAYYSREIKDFISVGDSVVKQPESWTLYIFQNGKAEPEIFEIL